MNTEPQPFEELAAYHLGSTSNALHSFVFNDTPGMWRRRLRVARKTLYRMAPFAPQAAREAAQAVREAQAIRKMRDEFAHRLVVTVIQ